MQFFHKRPDKKRLPYTDTLTACNTTVRDQMGQVIKKLIDRIDISVPQFVPIKVY